jgi:hypothetical protein
VKTACVGVGLTRLDSARTSSIALALSGLSSARNS